MFKEVQYVRDMVSYTLDNYVKLLVKKVQYVRDMLIIDKEVQYVSKLLNEKKCNMCVTCFHSLKISQTVERKEVQYVRKMLPFT